MSHSSRRTLVFVESPYSGDIDRHVRYLKLCKYDAWARGELGVASHDDMTQHPVCAAWYVSDYDRKWDVYTRAQAIEGAQALRHTCAKTVIYTDLGMSTGMKYGIEYCKKHDIEVELRKLDIEKVLSLEAPMISKEFVEAIVENKPYGHFLK